MAAAVGVAGGMTVVPRTALQRLELSSAATVRHTGEHCRQSVGSGWGWIDTGCFLRFPVFSKQVW